MPKFNFEVEVTGAVEAWELALALKDRFNGPYANAPIRIESVTECDSASEAYERGFEAGHDCCEADENE